jgi:hypothetical protein
VRSIRCSASLEERAVRDLMLAIPRVGRGFFGQDAPPNHITEDFPRQGCRSRKVSDLALISCRVPRTLKKAKSHDCADVSSVRD